MDDDRLADNLHSLTAVDHVMETSLTKTLAATLKVSVAQVYERCHTVINVNGKPYKGLQVTIERPDKAPLVAQWGGIPLTWNIKAAVVELLPPARMGRTELEKRLLAASCACCGATGRTDPIQVHHIRARKDLQTRTGREKPDGVKLMAARKRKTMVLCATCRQDITYGRPTRRSRCPVTDG